MYTNNCCSGYRACITINMQLVQTDGNKSDLNRCENINSHQTKAQNHKHYLLNKNIESLSRIADSVRMS